MDRELALPLLESEAKRLSIGFNSRHLLRVRRRDRLSMRTIRSVKIALLLMLLAAVGSPAEESQAPAVGATGEAAEAGVEAAAGAAMSFREDLSRFPRDLWYDVKSLPTVTNGVILGWAAGLSAVSARKWDEPVRDEVVRDPERIGGVANDILDLAGDTQSQLIASGAFYGLSLLLDHRRMHDVSLDFLHALVIESPVIAGLKYSFNSTRPDGKRRGFPSGHVSSTFAAAAVVHDNFGPWAGAAAYVFGAAVASQRIDAREHDLSDVIFGAALGYVVGSTTARSDSPLEVAGARVAPFVDAASGACGVGIERRF